MKMSFSLNNYNIILIIIILKEIFSKKNELISLNRLYEITLTINGSGSQNILNPNSYAPLPDIMIVNELQQSRVKYSVDLYQQVNTIVLKWNNPLTDCSYMFANPTNIIAIDLSNFNTSTVEYMICMFCGLPYLTSLNLTSFDTRSVIDMTLLFNGTKSLTSLDLSNFDTSKVRSMSMIFQECNSLLSLDLSSFDTSNANDLSFMFYGCNSLTSINLNNFSTSKATTISGMFSGCSSLSSLNLSSFDTSEVIDFNYTFYGCTSLVSLNLSNFVTSKGTGMRMMFYGCNSLSSLDLNSFDTSEVTIFSWMFYGCSSLKNLNVNTFITSKAKEMSGMFQGCSSLSSLNVSSFDTSNVNDFHQMFCECKSLQYLNISNFITTNGILMNGMFEECSSLLSLDLNSFKTSDVTNLGYMFADCTSLISLYLKNFDTSSCNEFSSMFESCSSLISLDLSNFIIPQNSNKENMFKKINENLVLCFDETKANIISVLYESNKNNCTCYQNSYKFFYEKSECIDSCSKDEIYKLEYENICYQVCPSETQISSTNTSLCEKDLICEKYYNYEYTGCIDEIPIGYYLNDTNRKTIDKCNIKCNECSLESVQLDLCISCNESINYFPKDNEINDTFKNCYDNDEEGYYLDINNKVYKPCYSTCKKCTEYGSDDNHKCTECYDNYTSLGSNCFESCNKIIIEKNLCIDDCSLDDEYIFDYNNICYKTCPNGTLSSFFNNSCIEYTTDETTDNTESSEISEFTDKNTEFMESTDKNTETTESTDRTTETIESTDKNSEITESTDKSTEITESTDKNTEIMESTDKNTETNELIDKNTEIMEYTESIKDTSEVIKISDIEDYQIDKDQMLQKIKNDIIGGLMNSQLSNVINGEKKDIIIPNDNIVYQITSTENQKNQKNKNNNASTIDLGKCEKTLRGIYGINDTEPLIILKVDYFRQDLLIPIIGYEVFHPENKTQLDLNYCKNNNINVSIPVEIDEDNLFKYDPNSDYYKDQCNPYTTKNGTDILINDRQNEFNENKMSLCENNCELNEYDNKKVVCECEIKVKQIKISEIENKADLVYHNFTSLDESSNMVTMKCYYTLFTKEGLKYNIGHYILLILILLFLTSSILFYKCGYPLIEAKINQIIDKNKDSKKKRKNSKEKANIYNLK